MTRFWQVAAAIVGMSFAACDSAKTGTDPDCSGSGGKHLTCDSPRARRIVVAKFDDARRCFEAPSLLSEFCAVPTSCPGGGGEVLCAVAPSGEAYLTYLQYGEETTKPTWHFSATSADPSTLTSTEEEVCKSLLDASDGLVDADGGVVDDRLLYDSSTSALVTPTCEKND